MTLLCELHLPFFPSHQSLQFVRGNHLLEDKDKDKDKGKEVKDKGKEDKDKGKEDKNKEDKDKQTSYTFPSFLYSETKAKKTKTRKKR